MDRRAFTLTIVGAVIAPALGSIAMGVTLAGAQTNGCGFLSGGNLGACLNDLLPGGTSPQATDQPAGGGGRGSPPAADQPAGSGPAEPSPYRWERHYWGDHNDPGFGTNSPFLCPKNPDGSDQLPYTDVMIDTRDGSEVRRQNGCQGVDDPATPANEGAPALPPPPPPPPSAGEVLDRIPIPDPTIGVSPVNGLAGARGPAMTMLWDANGAAPLSVTVTIRGYTVTATAGPEEWEWDMLASGPEGRNPSPILRATRPGTRDDPAATYTYETRGDYTITLRVRWRGAFTFSGNGVPSETRPLGTTTQESTTGYHVIEIRPVLEVVGT
jgi:hypothetical protein